jgi:adenosylmethionine-8-amino-7-oxononanoate aminotransferase
MPADIAQLMHWDRHHLWHPFTPMQAYAEEEPLIIQRGEGCRLEDVDGKWYIDGISSMWCNVHGHRVPQLDEAIRQQLDHVAHTTLLGLSHVPAIQLARKLVEWTPEGLEHVFFSDNGSTAVEVALKIAFQYFRQRPDPRPNKTRFLALEDAYHGDTLGDVSVGGISHFHGIFAPLLFPVIRAPSPFCYRCPLGLERATCKVDCAEALVDLVRQHHEELAAVVIEPLVQGAAGMIVAPEGYLRRVREVTREHDVLLIADEVATGFGRTGTRFACEQEGVVPDLLCLAKGLTAGYLPLAATLTTPEIYRAFLGRAEEYLTFFHGHTYTGNPLACAVALANLELLGPVRAGSVSDGNVRAGSVSDGTSSGDGSSLLATLPEKIERLATHLERIRSLPHVGDVRQKGLMAGIELVANVASKTPFPASKRMGHVVCQQARTRGAIVRPLGDVVVIMPPLAIELDLLDQLMDIVSASLQATLS